MTYLLAFISALVISMALIPLMARLAPRIGMIDRPEQRKVHVVPIPRAGGVGIVLGALVPIVMWLPMDALTGAYLFGAMVLLFFGVWDDIHELGHYVKFIGQFIAAIAVVYFGDLYITHFPFIDGPLTDSIGKPFTVFALMGMINAINHSDGLDGLAGGMSLLSLGCMSYLAVLADGSGFTLIVIALATLGGVFGFLRYNTHPARVFMGDGGSQFLGFTLGFLAIYLIEEVNPALSPALPALLLGLPIVDILAVFAQRIYHGMNWFRASKNHIHHRLLQLGFDHYEAVVVIYSVQTLLVVSAIFLAYESDFIVLSVYIGVCSLVFLFLILAERARWRAHRSNKISRLTRAIQAVKEHRLFTDLPVRYVAIAVPLLFVLASVSVDEVPRDFGIASAVLALILLLYMVLWRRTDSIVVQAVSYVTAAFVIYLKVVHLDTSLPAMHILGLAYFVTLAVAVGIVIRYDSKASFSTTPLDYLVIATVLFAGFLLRNVPEKAYLGPMAVKLVILFYACELIFSRAEKKRYVLNFSVLVTLTVFAVRGLI